MFRDALIITRREIRDAFRDWRIIAPIVILTLIFPWIMNLSTRLALNFVEEYNATIIPLRLVPFAVMIVGFFPISFSLIIALETFVGEKERNSLEPLLDTPISDASLYFGKLFAAVLPPVMASYLGVTTYLIGLYLSIQYIPEPLVLFQVMATITMQAVVMVSGAVIVSSHTTSVRAANLLASFIIIPMAFLLQGETVLLFWGQYDVIWYIIVALFIADVLLIRTGIRTFNREEILGREIDELNMASLWRKFIRYFGGPGFSLRRLYREDVPRILSENRMPISITLGVVLAGVVLGWAIALRYPLPPNSLLTHVDAKTFSEYAATPGFNFLPSLSTRAIFLNNVRALALATVFGVFSFGSLALILLLAPMAIVGWFAGEASALGLDPLTFLIAFILPHGIIELPAGIIATAFALRLGASIISPPPGMTAGENLLRAFADLVKIFIFVVLPMLLLAAWIEATITPQIVLWFYGR